MSAYGPGTKPGLRGQTVISTGQADLDRILGGGLPLGAVLLVIEDARSTLHGTFLRYFVAEGLACGHDVHWAAEGGEQDSFSGLPQLRNASSKAEAVSPAPEEKGEGLRIAFQYRRYIEDRQRAIANDRLGGKPSAFQRKDAPAVGSSALPASASTAARDWCHHFDISRPWRRDDNPSTTLLDRRSYQGEAAADQLLHAVTQLKGRTAHEGGSAGATAPRSARLDRTAAASPLHPPEPVRQQPASRPVRRLMGAQPPAATDKAVEGDGASQSEGGLLRLLGPKQWSSGILAFLKSLLVPAMSACNASWNSPALTEQRQARTAAGTADPTLLRTPEPRGNPHLEEAALLALPQRAERPPAGRLAVESLGSHSWHLGAGTAAGAAALLRLVHRLKALARGSRLAVMLSVPAGLYGDGALKRLLHLCDVGVIFEAVDDDSGVLRVVSDPSSCCGILSVAKLLGSDTAMTQPSNAPFYLIRHKRRHVSLDAFEVDPDAEAALGSGGATSVGLACAKPARPGEGPLDF